MKHQQQLVGQIQGLGATPAPSDFSFAAPGEAQASIFSSMPSLQRQMAEPTVSSSASAKPSPLKPLGAQAAIVPPVSVKSEPADAKRARAPVNPGWTPLSTTAGVTLGPEGVHDTPLASQQPMLPVSFSAYPGASSTFAPTTFAAEPVLPLSVSTEALFSANLAPTLPSPSLDAALYHATLLSASGQLRFDNQLF